MTKNRSQGADKLAMLRDNLRNAWAALSMIREAVEQLGPAGVMPSREAVVKLYGPEPVHEAQAIVEGIQKLARERASRNT